MTVSGPRAALSTQFSPTAASGRSADASVEAILLLRRKCQLTPGAVIQFERNALFLKTGNGSGADASEIKQSRKGQPYTALEASDPDLLLDVAGRFRRRRDQGVFSDLADKSKSQEILTGMCHKSP